MSTAALRVERDPAAVAHAAAHEFWDRADAATAERGLFRVALAGGHTPAGMYHEIVRQRPAGAAWSAVEFFFGDERGVPPEHPDSNYRMAKAALFDHAPAPAANIHRMMGEQRPLTAAAADYERVLAGRALDLVLLGIGSDGHTASLFPASPALAERERWVVATLAPTGVAVRERLTITLPCIARAREVWFLVTGASKAAIVARAILGASADPPLPASLVQAPRLTWILDASAAAQIARAGDEAL
ncbi:MAG: 6-phosphogluconolactonase [Gemmatimonadaceae bacterium]